jgi:D-alanyl-D-alanine carboxypeptidase
VVLSRTRVAVLVATVACVLAVAVVLVASIAGEARATEPGKDSSTTPRQQGDKGGLDPALEKSLEAAFEKSFKQSGAPGAIAAVRTPEGTWVSTLGVANRASGKPMRADMHHRVGSFTKTFTATLLLKADAEGLLSLDDTIDQYIKGVPNGDEITLRQMADMSSGIASYTLDEQFQKALFSNPRKPWKPEKMARIGIKDSPVFAPGKGWQYSNTNYIMLGLVLEQVTGKPIGKLYQKEIIEPLHLKETSFPNADPALPKPYDHGYTLQGQSNGKLADSSHWNPSWAWSAGGIISTVEDELVYGRALGTGEGLLPPEQQAERLTSFLYGLKPNAPQRAYGIGLVNQRGWLGHTGELPGYNTSIYYNAKLHTTMVVEVNTDVSVGDCPPDVPTMTDSPHGIPCAEPSDFVFGRLSKELGKPFATKQ